MFFACCNVLFSPWNNSCGYPSLVAASINLVVLTKAWIVHLHICWLQRKSVKSILPLVLQQKDNVSSSGRELDFDVAILIV